MVHTRRIEFRIYSFKSFCCGWNLRKLHLCCRFLSWLVDPQRLDNISTLLTLLMKVWHWFLNRPSLGFTVEPDMAALSWRFKLQATVSSVPNPTQYGRHTHSSFKQTKAAHNDQPCHYGRLIWSGPGHCGFIFFYAHMDVCHCLNSHHRRMYTCVCRSLSKQMKAVGPESLEHSLSFNCHLHTGRIINF